MRENSKGHFKKEPIQNNFNDLTLEDFARFFGTTVEDIPDECRKLIANTNFKYKMLEGKERDKVILEVLKKIESDRQIVGAKERQDAWEKGWEENLQDFIKSGYDLNKLVPKFIKPDQAIRLNQKFIIPFNQNFELDYFSIFRIWLFKKYLKKFDSIYEFGCGTGFNLVALAQLFPEKRMFGLDFVESSQHLVNMIGRVYGWKMTGHIFNMLSPDENSEIVQNSAVFTIGAIEQLAGNFEALLQFLLRHSPALCINVEPTIELYEENNLIDYLAVKFHRKRGYTESYLTRLRELEAQNKIELLKVKRLFFGSLFMEGYSYIIWKPLKVQ